jgi:hypothetical protein
MIIISETYSGVNVTFINMTGFLSVKKNRFLQHFFTNPDSFTAIQAIEFVITSGQVVIWLFNHIPPASGAYHSSMD